MTIINKHGVDGLTQHLNLVDDTSSQLNKSRTSRFLSSTPSLCGKPMDVWSYWSTERRHTVTHWPVHLQFSPSAAA